MKIFLREVLLIASSATATIIVIASIIFCGISMSMGIYWQVVAVVFLVFICLSIGICIYIVLKA